MAFHHAAVHAVHHHSPLVVLSVLALIAVAGYLISLRQHPRGRRCRACKGSGRQQGMIYRYANRSCTRCGGNGVRGRIGLRILKPKQVWGERAPERAAARRGQNWGR